MNTCCDASYPQLSIHLFEAFLEKSNKFDDFTMLLASNYLGSIFTTAAGLDHMEVFVDTVR